MWIYASSKITTIVVAGYVSDVPLKLYKWGFKGSVSHGAVSMMLFFSLERARVSNDVLFAVLKLKHVL